MGKPFQGDADWLNNNPLGDMLLEIGRIHLPKEPKNPRARCDMRLHAYAAMLERQVREMTKEEREQNLEPLKTAGWIRNFLSIRGKKWQYALARFVRGAIKYQKDHDRSQEELQAAA